MLAFMLALGSKLWDNHHDQHAVRVTCIIVLSIATMFSFWTFERKASFSWSSMAQTIADDDNRNSRYQNMITEIDGFWEVALEVLDDFPEHTDDSLVTELRENIEGKTKQYIPPLRLPRRAAHSRAPPAKSRQRGALLHAPLAAVPGGEVVRRRAVRRDFQRTGMSGVQSAAVAADHRGVVWQAAGPAGGAPEKPGV